MTQISDIGMAAFLKVVKGIKYAKVPKKGKKDKTNGSKFIFCFDITDKELEGYQSEYMNSDFRLFDLEIRSLKKIMHG